MTCSRFSLKEKNVRERQCQSEGKRRRGGRVWGGGEGHPCREARECPRAQGPGQPAVTSRCSTQVIGGHFQDSHLSCEFSVWLDDYLILFLIYMSNIGSVCINIWMWITSHCYMIDKITIVLWKHSPDVGGKSTSFLAEKDVVFLVEYVVLTHKSLKERYMGSLFPTPCFWGPKAGVPPGNPRGCPVSSGWGGFVSGCSLEPGDSCRLCPGVAGNCRHWVFSPDRDGMKWSV